ncbi:MAG: DUF177 domain-containing protein [Gorillibacterium sp.]|nr:DUF177 domain-containing protein [Gorillibacterium sp.]
MHINIKNLTTKEQSAQLLEQLDLSDLLGGRIDLVSFGTLVAELQAVTEQGVVEVTGLLTLPVTLLCSRCLCEVQETLAIPFRERFTKESIEDGDDSDLHLVKEDPVDLKPFVEEAVWMALPYIPLCSEDCEGLCPVCGVNRNEQDCGCKVEKIDPRLAGLADLFKE